VVAWSAEYLGLAVDSMRAAGRRVDDEVLAHVSPAHSENINFFGAIEVDIDAELAPPAIARCGSATPSSDSSGIRRECGWSAARGTWSGRWGQGNGGAAASCCGVISGERMG